MKVHRRKHGRREECPGETMTQRIKYSILIPVLNGLPYLKTAINSALIVEGADIEIIASDNGSTDGSREFLRTFDDRRFLLLTPDHEMSMSDHWEYLMQYATGDWQIFVGQDDALQYDFYPIAERLTAYAHKNGARSISTRRAYYFWPGTEEVSSGERVRYIARDSIRLVDTRSASSKILSGKAGYFDLPHMYTSSMFHKSLLEECKARFGGRVIQGHPQDAYLAAMACYLDPHFVRSDIPIGWVGTSTKSAGLAVSASTKFEALSKVTEQLRNDYITKIQKSKLSAGHEVDPFEQDLDSLYFWLASDNLMKKDSAGGNRSLQAQFPKEEAMLRSGIRKRAQSRGRLPYFWTTLKPGSPTLAWVAISYLLEVLLRRSISHLKNLVARWASGSTTAMSYILVLNIRHKATLNEANELVHHSFTKKFALNKI